jgi:hypothetical protein
VARSHGAGESLTGPLATLYGADRFDDAGWRGAKLAIALAGIVLRLGPRLPLRLGAVGGGGRVGARTALACGRRSAPGAFEQVTGLHAIVAIMAAVGVAFVVSSDLLQSFGG